MKTLLCLILGAGLCVASFAHAQVVTVTSRAAFNAVTTSQDIMAFDGAGYTFSGTPVLNGQGPYPDGMGHYRFTNGANTATTWNGAATLFNNTGSGIGITYTGPGGSGVEIVDSGNIGTGGNAVLIAQGSTDPLNGITLTLPTGAFDAVGFDLRMVTNSSQANSFAIAVNGTPTAVITVTDTAFSFVGFTSTSPINSIVITKAGVGGDPILDNITAASPTAVPEPSTLMTFAFGGLVIAGLPLLRRR